MSRVFLSDFKVGATWYEQAYDPDTEDVYISVESAVEPIYRVNQGGWVYNEHGSISGRFTLNDNRKWQYESLDKGLRMNTKFSDLLEAERDVFQRLLTLGYME